VGADQREWAAELRTWGLQTQMLGANLPARVSFDLHRGFVASPRTLDLVPSQV